MACLIVDSLHITSYISLMIKHSINQWQILVKESGVAEFRPLNVTVLIELYSRSLFLTVMHAWKHSCVTSSQTVNLPASLAWHIQI